MKLLNVPPKSLKPVTGKFKNHALGFNRIVGTDLFTLSSVDSLPWIPYPVYPVINKIIRNTPAFNATFWTFSICVRVTSSMGFLSLFFSILQWTVGKNYFRTTVNQASRVNLTKLFTKVLFLSEFFLPRSHTQESVTDVQTMLAFRCRLKTKSWPRQIATRPYFTGVWPLTQTSHSSLVWFNSLCCECILKHSRRVGRHSLFFIVLLDRLQKV